MQNTILVSVLVGAIAGAGGAFLTQAVVSTDAGPAMDPGSGLAPENTSLEEAMAVQIADLRRDNEDLALRLAALEKLGLGSGREEIPTTDSAELAKLREQIVELAAALDNPKSVEGASLRNVVSVALEDIRAAEEAERQREREEREIRRMDERMERISEELGLDAIQAKEMRIVLDTANEKRNAMFTAMRDGTMDRDEMRSSFDGLRNEAQTALQGILTPTQMQTFQDSSGRDLGLGGGRGFGGGGRNFGGGAGGRGGRGG